MLIKFIILISLNVGLQFHNKGNFTVTKEEHYILIFEMDCINIPHKIFKTYQMHSLSRKRKWKKHKE